MGNFHAVDLPSIVTCSFGKRACTTKTLPDCFWHKLHWQMLIRSGSGPLQVTRSCPQLHEAVRVAMALTLSFSESVSAPVAMRGGRRRLSDRYFINSTSGSFHVPSNKPALGLHDLRLGF